VVIPEFVVGVKSITNVLHGQNGLALKLSLLNRPATAVLSVPFHIVPAQPVHNRPRKLPTNRLPLAASSHALDQHRRETRVATIAPNDARIASLPSRCHATLTGEVTAARVVPRASSPRLELTVDDGSESITAIFVGRRAIAGLEPGRLVRLEGVLVDDNGRREMLNPLYTLLATDSN
jgi:hypothetical protein